MNIKKYKKNDKKRQKKDDKRPKICHKNDGKP